LKLDSCDKWISTQNKTQQLLSRVGKYIKFVYSIISLPVTT